MSIDITVTDVTVTDVTEGGGVVIAEDVVIAEGVVIATEGTKGAEGVVIATKGTEGAEGAEGAEGIDINKVISFLKNYNFINDIITSKLALSIPEEQNRKLMSILEFIYTDKQSRLPLKSIIQQIKEIFDDNKIDIYDVPTIIEIVSNFFNTNISTMNVQNVTIDDVALCIKVLLIVFIETKVVGNNMNIELPVIIKLFDSSLNLLKLHINVIKGSSCIKIFNCCK